MRIAFLLLLLLGVPIPAQATSPSPPVILSEDTDSYPLGAHMDILEDKGGALTFEDVTSPAYLARFTPLGQEIPNLGISRSAFWLRVAIFNQSEIHQHMILQQFTSWIDQMDLYTVFGLGEVYSFHAGAEAPHGQRPIPGAHFLFPLDIRAGEEVVLFVRLVSDEPIQAPFTLWRPSALTVHIQGLNIYYGMVLGVMMAMLLHNLFLFIAMRDRIHLYYVAFVASLVLMIAGYTGYSYQYLWPDSPWIQSHIVIPLGLLAMFLALVFSKSFLSTKTRLPGVHKLLTALQVFLVIPALFGLATGSFHFTNLVSSVTGMVFPVLMTAAGITAILRRSSPARLFTLAWALSILCVFYTMLAVLGYGPVGIVSQHALEVGLTLSAVGLSFALADKVNAERARQQIEEEEVRIVLTESKQDLEARVRERTAELEKAKELAEEATEMKDRFVGMVSHDLRAPIGSLINMMKYLKLENPDTPTIAINEEIVTRVIASSERLLRLVDNILNISRLSSGRLEINRKPTDMWHLVNAHVLDLEFLAMEKGVSIVNNMPRDYTLSVDPELFGEVLGNLLSNGIKFCRKRDTITIFRPEGQHAALAVGDTGVGIDGKVLTDIFRTDIRMTTPGTEGEQGTGLGLAYCHEIMLAHGGMITAESQLGKGTIFYLSLP
ncbi:MAG: sensor histidine kinase [Nitrospinota bacterium]|nr:sensor histidine kinase [Nitrospinota bacterium]